jgi:hypothetical protein
MVGKINVGLSKDRYRLLISALGILWLILGMGLWLYWERQAASVDVTWETATEQNTAGFKLYRREGENGEFVPVRDDQFIASQGGPTSGAAYHYLDDQVSVGKTYYYLLEEIEADGSQHRYEENLLEFQVADNQRLQTGVIALCFLAGGVMLFAGLRGFERS